jgi:hypothetical protein
MTRDELQVIVGKAMEPGQPIHTWAERVDTIMQAADLRVAEARAEGFRRASELSARDFRAAVLAEAEKLGKP